VRKIITAAIFFVFFSCSDSSDTNHILPKGGSAVFIVCEGNYGSSNSSLSVLDTVEYDTSFIDVYEPVNGKDLGVYAHDMYIQDSLGYISITGSNIVEIIDIRNFESVATIRNINAPRSAAVDQGKLLVTSYSDSSVYVFNIISGLKESSVKLSLHPNEIKVLDHKAFISCAPMDNDTVLTVISLQNFNQVRTISVGQKPVSIVTDYDRHLIYIACEGIHKDSGCIVAVDAQTETVTSRIGQFDNIHPVRIALNDTVLACIKSDNGPVRIYNLNTLSFTDVAGSYYSIQYHRGELFATDGGDFITSGNLIRFDTSYKVRNRYPVGIAPGAIIFQ
jgi:DNA-binding beta-propeller fold protein YncE